MNRELEQRLAFLIDVGDDFTADDVTAGGAYAVDPGHTPNGAQSAIGAALREAAANGWIEATGVTVRSVAPRRKGGRILVWWPTPKGRAWAYDYLRGRLPL